MHWLTGMCLLAVTIAVAVILIDRTAHHSSGAPAVGSGTPGSDSPSGSAASASTTSAQPATFAGPDGTEASWVVQENRRQGTTNWKLTGSASGIEGYADHVAAARGDSVGLYVSTNAQSFRVKAFRMGYYQGAGARLVWQSADITGDEQPTCAVTHGINMVQCAWSASTYLTIDSEWVPGQYLLKLVGDDGQQSYMPLTVWDPSSHATYVLMAGVLTDQVFNPYGGYDLYQGATPCAPDHYPCSTRARVVSFDRPFAGNGAGGYLGLMYPLTRFCERHGLDVTYWTDITLANHADLLTDHKVLISPGHDEEWSASMRRAAVTARDKGVNLIFFGASPVLRKVRLQPSPLGADRQVVNYRNPEKDPYFGKDNAEVSQNDWAQPPASKPASELVGATYIGFNNADTFPLVVSDPGSWLFAGTGLRSGAQIPGVLSTDFQAVEPGGDDPSGVQILAHSRVDVDFHPELQYADTTYYTLPSSGAGVFQSGTNTWISSLRDCPTTTAHCPAAVMRTLTGNLLHVFGAGPVGHQYPSHANWRKFYQ